MAGTSHKPPNLAPELSKETFHGESVSSGRARPSRPIPRALEDRKRCLGLNYPAVRRPAPDIPAGMSESGGRREQRPSAGWLSAGVTETAQTAADAIRQQAVQFARDVGHELSTTGETQKARGVDAIRQFARALLVRKRASAKPAATDPPMNSAGWEREIGGGIDELVDLRLDRLSDRP